MSSFGCWLFNRPIGRLKVPDANYDIASCCRSIVLLKEEDFVDGLVENGRHF
jgi:hypothetical protein